MLKSSIDWPWIIYLEGVEETTFPFLSYFKTPGSKSIELNLIPLGTELKISLCTKVVKAKFGETDWLSMTLLTLFASASIFQILSFSF